LVAPNTVAVGFKDGLASMTLYVGNRTGQRVELRVRYVGTGAASGLEAGAGEQDGLELTAPSGVTVAARDVRAIVLELRRPLSMPKIDGFLVVSALAGPTELLSVPINEAGAAEASGAFVGSSRSRPRSPQRHGSGLSLEHATGSHTSAPVPASTMARRRRRSPLMASSSERRFSAPETEPMR